jgi:hypothetical protein
MLPIDGVTYIGATGTRQANHVCGESISALLFCRGVQSEHIINSTTHITVQTVSSLESIFGCTVEAWRQSACKMENTGEKLWHEVNDPDSDVWHGS